MTKSRLIAVALLSLYLVWGSTYLAIAVAVHALPPLALAGVRWLVAGTILYHVARMLGASRPTRAQWVVAVKAGALLLVGGNGLVCIAEQYLGSGLASLLMATTGPQLVVVGWIAGRGAPRRREIAALAIGLLGVAVLVAPTLGGGAWLPVGALLLAATSRATGSLYLEGTGLPESATLASAMTLLAAGVQLVALATLTGEWSAVTAAAFDTRTVVACLWLVLGGSIIGGTAYTWLMRNAPRSFVASYAYVNPVVAVLLGWAVLDEVLGWHTALGAALVLASVVVLSSPSKPAVRSDGRDVPDTLGGDGRYDVSG